MPSSLPSPFLERLQLIVPTEQWKETLESFDREDPICVRINTLKISAVEAQHELSAAQVQYRAIDSFPEVFFLENLTSQACGELDLIKTGKVYRQSLSSLLPVIVLDPQPGERVLDLCAAPGSKTTQIAAAMKNQGALMAVEAIRPRFYRLKAVCDLLGVEHIKYCVTDGRRFRSSELFDRILVDAPCSSEGRFRTHDPDTFAYWSPRKIAEMVRKQRGLLLNATRLLKPGGTLVYSTCTYAPEENEGVIDWLLRKSQEPIQLQSISLPHVETLPAVLKWGKKEFSSQVQSCFRVKPSPLFEGFFICKLTKAVA